MNRRKRVLGACAIVFALGSSSAMASLDIPIYHSDLTPGAKATLYLDFTGDTTATWGTYSPGTTPAYDIDGDPSNFSAQELTNIYQIWSGVAEKYSPFNLDVTTQDPGNSYHGVTMRVVIGGNGSWAVPGSGGIAQIGGFFASTASNTAFVFPDNLVNGNPRYVAESAAHEAGHMLGLYHQSVFDNSGNLIAEYNTGTAAKAPIMGESYFATLGQWWYGPSSDQEITQDDLRLISAMGTYRPNIGYRADDHGSTIATADALTVNPDETISGYGIIEQNTDVDDFSFNTPGGTAHLIANVNAYAPMLDLTLSLYDMSGDLLAQSATASPGEQLTYALGAGEYVLSVSSAGGYGDIGQYYLSGSVVPEPGSISIILAVMGFLPLSRRQRRRHFEAIIP